jgi:hypothetical protein
MIQFRCWYCNKRYSMPEARIGDQFSCACRQLLRVPKYRDGNSRVKTPVDWLVEALVYGGGGAALGVGLGLLILSQWRGMGTLEFGWVLLPALGLLGFLFGLLGGERGINWIGRMIREQEQ